MRTLLRILFVLMFVVGTLIGIVYPQAVEHVAGYEVGRFRVFDREGGFRPAEAMLSPAEAPVFITAAMETDGPLRAGAGERRILTVSVAREDGAPVFRRDLDFPADGVRDSPQDATLLYRQQAGSLDEADGRHRVVAEAGPDFPASVVSVDIILNAGAFDLDPRAVPAGYILLAVGVLGFVLTLKRGKPKDPPAPRWGRGE